MVALTSAAQNDENEIASFVPQDWSQKSFTMAFQLNKENIMSLAQVIYNISSDQEFAAQWQVDPDKALDGLGAKLSREEMAFLFSGLANHRNRKGNQVRLADLAMMHRGWM